MAIDSKLYEFASALVRQGAGEKRPPIWVNPAWLRQEYEEVDRTTHVYKSAAGQKDNLVETNRLFFHMSDSGLEKFGEKLKKTIYDEGDEYNYLDTQILQDILHGHKCMRWPDKHFDYATMQDITRDYFYDVRMGVQLGLDDAFLRQRALEILQS